MHLLFHHLNSPGSLCQDLPIDDLLRDAESPRVNDSFPTTTSSSSSDRWIVSASMADPFVALLLSDGTLRLLETRINIDKDHTVSLHCRHDWRLASIRTQNVTQQNNDTDHDVDHSDDVMCLQLFRTAAEEFDSWFDPFHLLPSDHHLLSENVVSNPAVIFNSAPNQSKGQSTDALFVHSQEHCIHQDQVTFD